MKRFISILAVLCILSSGVFAQEEGDVYDDGYVYTQNGFGDQCLKIDLGALFPLNFGNHLYVGGTADLGYYYFLNSWMAIGGEVTATYNVSLGEKILVMLPVTLGFMFQPSVWKFEFPITVTAGVGYETWQNMNYFPSLAVKGSAGMYYRLTDSWSFGLNSQFMWIPQWFKDPKKNVDGLFMTASLGARYHF